MSSTFVLFSAMAEISCSTSSSFQSSHLQSSLPLSTLATIVTIYVPTTIVGPGITVTEPISTEYETTTTLSLPGSTVYKSVTTTDENSFTSTATVTTTLMPMSSFSCPCLSSSTLSNMTLTVGATNPPATITLAGQYLPLAVVATYDPPSNGNLFVAAFVPLAVFVFIAFVALGQYLAIFFPLQRFTHTTPPAGTYTQRALVMNGPAGALLLKDRWKIVCIFGSVIFGLTGAVLTGLSTTDADAHISNRKASILGVTYTGAGIIFASLAG